MGDGGRECELVVAASMAHGITGRNNCEAAGQVAGPGPCSSDGGGSGQGPRGRAKLAELDVGVIVAEEQLRALKKRREEKAARIEVASWARAAGSNINPPSSWR